MLGDEVGPAVGALLGLSLGDSLGESVGAELGLTLGAELGCVDGTILELGAVLGAIVGHTGPWKLGEGVPDPSLQMPRWVIAVGPCKYTSIKVTSVTSMTTFLYEADPAAVATNVRTA
jgi:hypothetical protein